MRLVRASEPEREGHFPSPTSSAGSTSLRVHPVHPPILVPSPHVLILLLQILKVFNGLRHNHLQVQREPHDRLPSGDYYRLWPEGVYHSYDGFTQRAAPAYSQDANRQYPYNYDPEGSQRGAGPHPGYLPQVRCVCLASPQPPILRSWTGMSGSSCGPC